MECLTKELTEINQEEGSIERFCNTYFIPDSKAEDVVNYIKRLKFKFPSMKGDRLLRKVAEYYNLKKK